MADKGTDPEELMVRLRGVGEVDRSSLTCLHWSKYIGFDEGGVGAQARIEMRNGIDSDSMDLGP